MNLVDLSALAASYNVMQTQRCVHSLLGGPLLQDRKRVLLVTR